jgi:SPP1 family predicted phage head-tail adaptor
MSGGILASRLRERITIEQPNRTPDTYGGQVVTWTTLATVYASVVAITGSARETHVAGQSEALAGYRITIRKRDDVRGDMRIQWRNRTLQIHSLHETLTTLEILAYSQLT